MDRQAKPNKPDAAAAPVEIHIRRHRGWFDIDWVDFWHYRDLLLLMVRRDFLSKYKQTVLGPVWFVFQPLVSAFIFTLVFNRVAKVPTDGIPATLFYLTGLLVWNYFNVSFNSVASSLRVNSNIFGKVYFPRLIAPVAGSLSSMISVAVQLFTWVIVYTVIKLTSPHADTFGLTAQAPLLLLLLAQVCILSLGVGLLMAAATAKYRDLSFTLGFIIQSWFYLTPVVYPLSQVPEKWRWLASINPMTGIVEATREILLGQSVLNVQMMATSLGLSLILFFIGVIVFNQVQRTFVDVL